MSRVAAWPRSIAFVLVLAAWAGIAAVAPGPMAALGGKEGPVEHLSHVILLAAVLVWLGLGASRRRAFPFVAAGYLAFVLAEEIDWGEVYGLYAISAPMTAAVGRGNLHNALHGLTYVLFAVPVLGYFAAPARILGSFAPLGDERACVAAIALLLMVRNPWGRAYQEVIEAALYALLLGCGVRLLRRPPAREGEIQDAGAVS